MNIKIHLMGWSLSFDDTFKKKLHERQDCNIDYLKNSNNNPVWKEFSVYMDYLWDYQNLPVQV